jgi:hypothetical protein
MRGCGTCKGANGYKWVKAELGMVVVILVMCATNSINQICPHF